jgi:hypothetical protein
MAFIALGFASTSGVKYALFIGEEFSFNSKSILVSHSIISQFSSSTLKCDNPKVTGITLHLTFNNLEICFNHLSKSQVISAIAAIIRFQRLCPEIVESLSNL